MSRLIALLLSIFVVLSLCACDATEQKTPAETLQVKYVEMLESLQ